ncbi:MAG: acd, partial [Phenylobacterium sp.]|nr:acd [Phenylobacterium sp.]
MTYQPPVRDYAFLLRDVLELERYANLPAFADASIDTVDQILKEAGRFTAEVLAPLNRVGDKEGCHWSPDFTVKTPTGFQAAYRQLVEGGWPALGADPNYGGQGLPAVVNLAFSEMSSGANMAFSMYPGLTHGAYSAILNGGSPAQKDLYLPKLASGQWGGTMNLTEPHCGTDLGLLRTKAVPQADGSYRISGQKIWISGGEHDLTENIIHLVLARIEGAPQGTRGISLFIVPKFIPDEQGDPGVRNAVKCLGLEEKMGIHGNATCVIGHEEATGWLVGEENRGLS